MKKTLVILSVLVCSTLLVNSKDLRADEQTPPVAAKPAEILTNISIIELGSLAFDDAVIIEKIKTSKCDFDVSMDGLKLLKQAKISGAVIQAMIASKAPAAPTAATASTSAEVAGDPNDPKAPHKAGVYLSEDVGGQKKLTKIIPESASGLPRSCAFATKCRG